MSDNLNLFFANIRNNKKTQKKICKMFNNTATYTSHPLTALSIETERDSKENSVAERVNSKWFNRESIVSPCNGKASYG